MFNCFHNKRTLVKEMGSRKSCTVTTPILYRHFFLANYDTEVTEHLSVIALQTIILLGILVSARLFNHVYRWESTFPSLLMHIRELLLILLLTDILPGMVIFTTKGVSPRRVYSTVAVTESFIRATAHRVLFNMTNFWKRRQSTVIR